jgi:hypothetical protein
MASNMQTYRSTPSQQAIHLARWLRFKYLHREEFAKLQEARKPATTAGHNYRPFDEHHCIFVHIPKCAGVSVCRSLFGNLAGGHTPIQKYQLIFSPTEFSNYFKFTIVRNPWDRVVSAFLFLKGGGMNNEYDRNWAARYLADFDDFNSFARGWLTKKNINLGMHFRPQRDFICLQDGRIGVDFVGHFENIDADFAYICNKLKIQAKLSKVNSTSEKQPDFQRYYTVETRQIVADAYADDIRLLGYAFDGSYPAT